MCVCDKSRKKRPHSTIDNLKQTHILFYYYWVFDCVAVSSTYTKLEYSERIDVSSMCACVILSAVWLPFETKEDEIFYHPFFFFYLSASSSTSALFILFSISGTKEKEQKGTRQCSVDCYRLFCSFRFIFLMCVCPLENTTLSEWVTHKKIFGTSPREWKRKVYLFSFQYSHLIYPSYLFLVCVCALSRKRCTHDNTRKNWIEIDNKKKKQKHSSED